jgi:hypothetical protein
MITRMLLKRRVRRGAKLLDEKKPNWYLTIGGAIFDGTFRMSDWGACVVGKLELISWGGKHAHYPVITLNGTVLVGYAKAGSHGFYVDTAKYDGDYTDAYQELRDLWREEVEKRLTVSEARALGMRQV